MMTDSFSPLVMGRWVVLDLQRAWRALLTFQVAFKLVEAWLFAPTVTLLLAFVLRRAGHLAISNQDILQFFRSPLGVAYLLLFSTVVVALLLLELAGMIVIVTMAKRGEWLDWRRSIPAILFTLFRVSRLGFLKSALFGLSAIPFLLLAVGTYVALLSQHDIYFYWKERPPVFWQAVGVGVLLAIGAAASGIWLGVRWIFALPILLFEPSGVREALRTSRDRTRGIRWPLARLLLLWLGGMLLIGSVTGFGFRQLASFTLARSGNFPLAAILLLLLLHGLALALWSFLSSVGLALLIRRLYISHGQSPSMSASDKLALAATSDSVQRALSPRFAFASKFLLWGLLLFPIALWLPLPQYLSEPRPIQITAHRGHARLAPENTLSAIRMAIESRADYAEIDVQLTADEVVVLLHDRDLKRVAGVARPLAEMTYDELQQLDVGRWFSEKYVGERVPTLRDVMEFSRGKIKLNIELKFYGPDPRLTAKVVDLIREEEFESECIVTSLSHDACVDVKQLHPEIRTGLIVAHALGNLSRLEMDVLSIRADFLSPQILKAARRADREVHVWTVNQPRRMVEMMMRGVDNMMTSDPDLGVRVRDEWQGMYSAERLLLAARLLLGLPIATPD